MDLSGDNEPRLLRKTPEHDTLAQLSPDEKWLAFSTRESGEWQVYVAPWPAMAPITQVSTTSGTWSEWTKGGNELVFLDGDGGLHAVSMTPDGGLMTVGPQEALFEVESSRPGERLLVGNRRRGEVLHREHPAGFGAEVLQPGAGLATYSGEQVAWLTKTPGRYSRLSKKCPRGHFWACNSFI